MKQYVVRAVTPHTHYTVADLVPRSQSDRIIHLPGQYTTLSVHHDGRWSPTRCLSMTSTPTEDGALQFAFRVTGAFTSTLAHATPGEVVRIQGPFGNFVVRDTTKNVIMIAGGIGITPFMSMIRTTIARSTSGRIVLFYACRSEDDIPFIEELRALEAANSAFHLRLFLSTATNSSPHIQKGPISTEYLRATLGTHASSFSYYICGPDSMMQSLTKQLVAIGVHDENIVTESFAASSTANARFLGLTPTQMTYAAGMGAFAILAGGVAFKDVQHTIAHATTPPPSTTTQQTQPTPITSPVVAAPETPSPVTVPDTPTITPPATTETPVQTQPAPTSDTTGDYQPPRSGAS